MWPYLFRAMPLIFVNARDLMNQYAPDQKNNITGIIAKIERTEAVLALTKLSKPVMG